MGVATLTPVEEYLNTAFDPDMEYVDGVLVERYVGDWLHSLIQRNLIVSLSRKYPLLYTVPELRSKVAETRYRLPDICVLLTPPPAKYQMDAAFLAVEILSEEDSMTKVMEKLSEYAEKGVPNIWVIDPRLRSISTYRNGALALVTGDVVRTSENQAPILELSREEIFFQA